MKIFIKKNRGFTLIELLVVVAIIGLLASVVLSSLNSARLKSRTTRGIEDLNQLRTALEIYYAEKGEYPLSSGGSNNWGGLYACSPYWTGSTIWIVGLTPNYIASLPRSPNNSTNGCANYAYKATKNDYKIIWHGGEDCVNIEAKYPNLNDPARGCSYGFWSPGGTGF